MKIYHVVDKRTGEIMPTTFYDRKDAELMRWELPNAKDFEIIADTEPDPKCCNNPNNLFLSQGGLVKK
jgi:hypothetical protein